MAGARHVRWQLARPSVAVQDRHQRLSRHVAADRPPGDLDPDVRRGPVADALSRPPARRGRAERRGARRGRRRARDDRARLPRRAPGPAAAPAGDADRPRHPRLAGRRDGVGARHDGRRRQQRAPASPGDDAGPPARPGAPTGRPASRAPRNESCSTSSSRPTSAAMPPSRSRSRPRICGSRCRRTRPCSRVSRRSRRFSSARCPRATGAWCRRPPTGCRRRRATCERRATRSSAPFKLDVLRVVDGRIAEITTFGAELFPQFGLAPTL